MYKALSKALAENAKNMSVDELEAYHKALEKIRNEQEKREPFVSDNEIKKIKELIRLERQLREEEEKRNELQGERNRLEHQRRSFIDLIEKAQEKIDSGELASTQQYKDGLINTTKQIEQVDSMLSNSEMTMANIGAEIEGITGGAQSVIAIIDMVVQIVNEVCDAAKKTFEDIMEMADSFGVETDKGSWREASHFFEGMSNFNAEVTEGWENFKNGNFAGALANVVGSITGFIRDVNKWKDSNLEEQIQKQIEDIENLSKEYERLEWAIDRAFSFKKYGMVAEQQENLAKQIENTQKAIAAEEDKKDTDKDRIEELQGEIEEASKQIQELYDNLRADIVGTFEDLSSTLGDAMISALQQGEDALKAWSDSVNDIITDIVGQLLIQKYLEPQIANLVNDYYSKIMPKNARAENKYQEYLKAIERGDSATAEKLLEEYKKLAEQAIGEVPQINEDATKQFQSDLLAAGENFKDLIPDWLINSTKEGGGLSALQKGIQGITESTAQVLEAIANSSRGYLANIDSKMDLVLANLGAGAEENPMLEQMRLVAKNTSAINTLLNSLVKGGHPQGGQGLKVFMD